MAGDSDNQVRAIAEDDPLFSERPHLDFQRLRREGLQHIGELSGRIWTDHNAHDPGVTLLEALCFALIDLGYRATLPMADLLAAPQDRPDPPSDPEGPLHDNFFTPLEILSCNPTTELDFRKLLLDLPGVRNAWLEPEEVDASEFLSTNAEDSGDSSKKLLLNGCYRVLIEPEQGADDKKLRESVAESLCAHRNLCEDFSSIVLLDPYELGVCAEVEIEQGADADVVYEAILRAVIDYISPELRYYSLKELLDRGRAIEHIIAGRPFTRTSEPLRSAGFVDNEELLALPYRRELYGSDLSAAILRIDGVIAVRALSLQLPECAAARSQSQAGMLREVCIPTGHVARFSLDRTCIQLQAAQGVLYLEKARIHRRLGQGGKPMRGLDQLDLPVPQGRHRRDLVDYPSVQRDLPLVYGVGPAGLPREASLARKVQAMQLKGYLLFYDQLLANYLAQLGNLRQLFSLRQESKRSLSVRRSYFSQAPDSMLDQDRLLLEGATKGLGKGQILAMPVADDEALAKKLDELRRSPLADLRVADSCGSADDVLPHLGEPSQALLELRIRQLIRDFQQGAFSTELLRDASGHLFMLRGDRSCEVLLISYRRYRSREEAREAANFTAFLAGRTEYYVRRAQAGGSQGEHIEYQFDLAHDPAAYSAYLRFLVEDPKLYLERREAFLDHLLARFAAQFTDYAMLRFGTEVLGEAQRAQTIEDKSRYLSRVDSLSRDRGRAYDYLQASWGTDNVSGFEKRVSLLAGMSHYQRRHLSKFEVEKRFRIEMDNPQGERWFSSIATYETRQQLADARKKLIEQLADPDSYQELRNCYRDFDPQSVRRVFSQVATDDNLEPSTYVYALILRDDEVVLDESAKQDYSTEKRAWSGLNKFIGEIKRNTAMTLVELSSESQPQEGERSIRLYYDEQQMQCIVDPIITYKWHRQYSRGGKPASADSAFDSSEDAFADFVHNGDHADLVFPKQNAVFWRLNLPSRLPQLESLHAFDNRLEAEHAWRRCRSDGQLKQRYRVTSVPGRSATHIALHSENGFALASAELAQSDQVTPEQFIEGCRQAFADNEARPEFAELKTAYGWRVANADRGATDDQAPIMESTLLYREIRDALNALIHALEVARRANHYFEAGGEENPDYRIFLRSKGGPFLAATRRYADAAERTAHVKKVRDRMRRFKTPFEVKEEPRRYRWTLVRGTNKVLMQSAATEDFASEDAAREDFRQRLLQLRKKNPKADLARQVYTITTLKLENKFRFVYTLYGAEEQAPTVLKSEQEFTRDQAKQKYKDFVSALPRMELKTTDGRVHVSAPDAPTVQLIDDDGSGRQRLEEVLKFRSALAADTMGENSSPKWIYRVLDLDNPIAKSCGFDTELSAREVKARLCGYQACGFDHKQDTLQVICPRKDKKRHHFALYLGTRDDHDKAIPTLISHMGYESEEAARNAGEKHWLRLIEVAADLKNYGEDRIIADTEIFADSSGADCDQAAPYLAVKHRAITKEKAVDVARCYPLRNTYKKDRQGKLTSEVIGIHFQGYDRERGRSLWRSSKDYSTPELALEAYRLFLTLLKYSDSCRIVCEEGVYRYHLVEILAESTREFERQGQAWGDLPQRSDGQPEKPPCVAEGVRLFAHTATVEAAFVSLREGNCFRFRVVDKGYRLARHTCDYRSSRERDQAIERLRGWSVVLRDKLCRTAVAGIPALTIQVESGEVKAADGAKSTIRVSLGKGYFLQGLQEFEGLPSDQAKEAAYRWIWLATDKRNLRSGQDRGESKCFLFDPFSEQPAATVGQVTKDGQVITNFQDDAQDSLDIDDLVECARAYPVYVRNGRYHFRLYHPQNSARWDEQLEFCCPKTERTEQAEPDDFCNQTHVLESCESYATRGEAEQAFGRLLALLGDIRNYCEEQDAAFGSYSFCILDFAKELASHPHCHPDRASAKRAEQRTWASMQDEGMHLVEHILLRPEGKDDCRLPSCPDSECQLEWQKDADPSDPCESLDDSGEAGLRQRYVPGLDPYSFWATLVLPSWTERFRNRESRHFFRQMLHREAPMLVGLNIVWLGPRQMSEFEKVLRSWLESLRRPNALCKDESGRQSACALIEQISGLRNEPVCADIGAGDERCDCDKEPDETAHDDCIETPDSLFWRQCDEQDPAVETNVTQPETQDQGSLESDPVDATPATSSEETVIADTADRESSIQDIAEVPTAAPATNDIQDPSQHDQLVRSLLNERKERYLQAFLSIDPGLVKDAESFKRADDFLRHPPPTLSEFKKLIGQLKQDNPRRRTNKAKALLKASSYALWYLLDQLLHQSTAGPAVDAPQLSASLKIMKQKGADLQQLAAQWHGEELADLLGPRSARLVEDFQAQILQLIKQG